MARKHRRLPNGYGSICYLGKNRRNPYAVYPPCKECNEEGTYLKPKALCYCPDYYTAFAVLSAYHSGQYVEGMELEIVAKNTKYRQERILGPAKNRDAVIDVILAAYNQKVMADGRLRTGKPFRDLYQEWYTWKYDSPSSKEYSKSSRGNVSAAYKHLKDLYDLYIEDITIDDMQKVVDKTKSSNIRLIEVGVLRQMFRYAMMREYIAKDYSVFVKAGEIDKPEEGKPFSKEDILTLWEYEDNPDVEFILIMIYSGFRIEEYRGLEINLDLMYFKGGIKTKAGKGRIVPIHSEIQHLVRKRVKRMGCLYNTPYMTWSRHFKKALSDLGLEERTPHDTRHTFSALLEDAKVTDSDRKRLLGHSLTDVTSGVYGHRTLDQLRESIEQIKIRE